MIFHPTNKKAEQFQHLRRNVSDRQDKVLVKGFNYLLVQKEGVMVKETKE